MSTTSERDEQQRRRDAVIAALGSRRHSQPGRWWTTKQLAEAIGHMAITSIRDILRALEQGSWPVRRAA